jgi:hypothetical protein
MAEGTTAATAQETEEGHMMDEALDLDNDDGDFNIPLDDNLDGEFSQSNQSTATATKRISPSASRKGKRKKASMAGSMDSVSEALNKIHEGMLKPYIIKVDQGESDSVAEKIYDALKAIPGLTEDTMIRAYDTFLVETARAKGFLRMDISERIKYIVLKHGGL